MSTGFIAELFDKCEQHNLKDIEAKLRNILESVLYHDARPDHAREQLDDIWLEIDAEIELLSVPPDEEQLSLLNPSFDVE